MKKLVVLLAIFILAAGLCFAQIVEEAPPPLPKPELFDLEVSVGYPVHWTNAEHNKEFYTYYDKPYLQLDKTATAHTSIGVSLLWNFGRKIGLTLDTDFFYGTRMAGSSLSTSDSTSMFSANALLAPVFFIYNGTFLRVPLAIGVHAYFFHDELWAPYLNPSAPDYNDGFWLQRDDFQVGPGIYLGVQFHFNSSVYIFSRTNVSIDIFRWHQVRWIIHNDLADDPLGPFPAYPLDPNDLTDQTKSEIEWAISWHVKPVIGIGIKF